MAAILVVGMAAIARGIAFGTTSSCANLESLTGSRFEIDTNANTAVNTTGCLDWDIVVGNTQAKNDLLSGSGDDSFGQGTAEDNPNPTIVDGSIPPQKSDLLRFGVHTESGDTTTGKFLELYWARINQPNGTTNMDFELNKIFCEGNSATCANNGTAKKPVYVTPKRSVGDKLITYDLSQGGTNPTISIRNWDGSAWGSPTLISGATGLARGSVNTTQFTAAPTTGIGARDPFTFGEAAINYNALFSGNTCGTFASAYLKSRSSDSFPAELKDFVSPEQVNITNCSSITTTLSSDSVTPGTAVHDSATLSGVTANAGGSVTYKVYTDSACTAANEFANAGTKTVTNGIVPDSDAVTFNDVGDFYWQAQYSGDGTNAGSTSLCTSEHLVVNKVPSTIETAQSFIPNDSATITTATGSLGGSVTFKLYSSLADCQSATPPTPLYSETRPVSGSSPQTVETTNDGDEANGGPVALFTIDASNDAHFFWNVSYSGDGTHEGDDSACVEDSTVTIDNTTAP